ncbi:hypothetical protein C7974DRAFT_402809 [Boeremia exigua]|uniref:uncharacterized protein n=1 Tax=Boeremia exigua TaxID=749465 RepID=UPI001E8D2B59|nr:uncharacterized protein C7974DRAFT_402809 [Boeremia exigua]KAH6614869.1 hypothetical protein C7974DRAFT_402809 [Boeremia exigua]
MASLPRLLLPRQPLLRPTRLAQSHRLLLLPASARHVSNARQLSAEFERRRAAAASTKQHVIPQPDKYRAPSHGKTIRRSDAGVGKVYGPKPTEEDRKRMATKKYPNMMSPEGTFSHWFLNNRAIHTWITMGILVSLAVAAWYMDFMAKTVYAELVPDRREFLRHPVQSTKRFVEVYKMHMAQTSQVYSEQRLKKAEDVEKRKLYRLERQRMAEEMGEEYVTDSRYYIGEDGVRRRRVKRWFGIWE